MSCFGLLRHFGLFQGGGLGVHQSVANKVLSLASSACLLVGLLSLTGSPTQASERDHDQARAALASGDVLPLTQLLKVIQPPLPGEVLEVELERDRGRWIYELKVLQVGGRLRKVKVDARTGEWLQRGDGRGQSERRPEERSR
jgi:hypothetical protein